MKKTKAQKGITLIALIITIIVLLILAVVSIREITGDGIIAKARQAATEYSTKQDEERDILSQYELMIGEQTGKAWKANKDADGKEVSFTKGDITVTLGDIVNYNHTKDEAGTTITGENASYTSPMEKSGYTSDQTFTLSSYSGGWKVIGVKNGQLRLVSTANIATYYLNGQTGYQNGVEELDNICAIYGQGKGADKAESIKVEDINRITGYDPTTYSGYGDKHEYKRDGNILYHKVNDGQPGNGIIMGEDCPPNFNLLDGTALGTEWKKFESTYYYYQNPVIESMFTSDCFWIASPFLRNEDNSDLYFFTVGLYTIDYHYVMGELTWNAFLMDEVNPIPRKGIRPVVSLKSDIELTPNGENSWNIQ